MPKGNKSHKRTANESIDYIIISDSEEEISIKRIKGGISEQDDPEEIVEEDDLVDDDLEEIDEDDLFDSEECDDDNDDDDDEEMMYENFLKEYAEIEFDDDISDDDDDEENDSDFVCDEDSETTDSDSDDDLFDELEIENEYYVAKTVSENLYKKVVGFIIGSMHQKDETKVMRPVGIRMSNKDRGKTGKRQLLFVCNDGVNERGLVNKFKNWYYMWIETSDLRRASTAYFERFIRKFSKDHGKDLPYISQDYADMIDKRVLQVDHYIIVDDEDDDNEDLNEIVDRIRRTEKQELAASDRLKKLNLTYGSSVVKNLDQIKELLPEWIQQFKKQYNISPELIKHILESDKISLISGIADNVVQPYEFTVKHKTSAARKTLAAFTADYLKKHPEFTANHKIRLTKSGLLSCASLFNMFPDLMSIIKYYFRQKGSDHHHRLLQFKQNPSEELLMSGMKTFLHYAMFVKRKMYKDIWKYLSDVALVTAYSNDLTTLLLYKNVNTIRKKIESVVKSINYKINPKDVAVDFLDVSITAMRESKRQLLSNPLYRKEERSKHVYQSHSAATMQSYGQLMSPELFWSCYAKSIDIVVRWVYFWFCTDNISIRAKKKILQQNGHQFNNAFIYWFSLYTFVGRRQLYLQSNLDDLVLTTSKTDDGKVFQQWYFAIGYGERDNFKVIEKVSRELKLANYSLGISNNLIIYFYKFIFVPTFINKRFKINQTDQTSNKFAYFKSSLFYSKTGIPLEYLVGDRNKLYTNMLKDFSLAFGGVKLTNQLIRTHYNTYCMQLHLSQREKDLLHRGMNHSAHTADQHYIIFNSSINAFHDGNIILESNLPEEGEEEKTIRKYKDELVRMNLTVNELSQLISYGRHLIVNRE